MLTSGTWGFQDNIRKTGFVYLMIFYQVILVVLRTIGGITGIVYLIICFWITVEISKTIGRNTSFMYLMVWRNNNPANFVSSGRNLSKLKRKMSWNLYLKI